MAENKNKIYFRQNILFLLDNGYKLTGFDSTSISSDFGEKKCITYHFVKGGGNLPETVLDITESNLFNIDLQVNSTFRAKYIGGVN